MEKIELKEIPEGKTITQKGERREKMKKGMLVVISIVGLLFLSGCAGTNQTIKDKSNGKSMASSMQEYPVPPIQVPASWIDTAKNDKVIFEGYFLPTTDEKDHKQFQIRAFYTEECPKDRYNKEPFTLGYISLLDVTEHGIEGYRILSWRIGEDPSQYASVRAAPDRKEFLFEKAKNYPTVKEDFLSNKPICCRSILSKDDIPNTLRLSLSLPQKETFLQKVAGVVAVASMLAAPVAILVAAPLQIGAAAAAQTFGLAAGASAGQLALANVAKADFSGNVEAVLTSPGQQEIPECFDMEKLKGAKKK